MKQPKTSDHILCLKGAHRGVAVKPNDTICAAQSTKRNVLLDPHINVLKKMGSAVLLFLFTSLHLHLLPDDDVIFSIYDLVS